MTPPTTDGVSPLHQIVGNISTRRRITRKSLRSDRRPVSLCEPLCAVLPGTAGTDTGQGREGGFGLVFEGLRGTKRKAGESEWVVTTHSRSQTPAVRTFSEFHFPSPKTGTMFDPDSFRHTHDKILKAIGAEHIRFHDLRHTFATLSLKNGVDVKTLSGALGHYSAGFTLSTYTHATAEMKRDAADTIGNVISQAM